MKLDDPFGRVGRRQTAGYKAVKSQLLAQGVSNTVELAAVTRRITRSALLFALLVLAVSVMAGLLVPSWRPLIAVFAGLAVIWIGATFLRTRLFLKRFHAELDHAGAAQAQPDDNDKPTRGEHP